ncbi:hypothetical protein [Leptospira kanakyensis]|uniref:hypothetical protein n=1 Tax=Leptospira kanakyensis TaxID=2484968 RepID=UPI00223DDBAA|nr:hypothetical protein [Leptospira kanakyensis]MCW7480356.1 hypothetical protein [Leptospira kanakyensis]
MFLDKVLRNSFFFLMILIHINCTNQKQQCLKGAETKGGEKYQDSQSACTVYLALTESAKISEEQGKSSFTARFLANEALAICLLKVVEESKCKSKSEYVPHFGY